MHRAPSLMQRSADSRSRRNVTRCRATFCAHSHHLQIDAQQQSAAASRFNKLFNVLRSGGFVRLVYVFHRICFTQNTTEVREVSRSDGYDQNSRLKTTSCIEEWLWDATH